MEITRFSATQLFLVVQTITFRACQKERRLDCFDSSHYTKRPQCPTGEFHAMEKLDRMTRVGMWQGKMTSSN
jgi:hypothetical protein